MPHEDHLPFLLPIECKFPDTEYALDDPNGLLAVGGDLSSERLILAYQKGIFPWYSDPNPILWWSPNPRAVLYLDELKVSRSLKKSLRNRNFEVWLNKDFELVMQNCAEIRAQTDGTWITEAMRSAYLNLHHQGLAHCIAVYSDGQLVGGLYGISQGRFFFGESMFSKVSDASKVALFYLVEYLKRHDFLMIDCQVSNDHLESLGSRSIPREDFIKQLELWVESSQPESLWQQMNLTEHPTLDSALWNN